jgi:Glycosyltransferases involved in cell wall biogenesis
MSLSYPLLSIVIPTKNRYETLLPVVRGILRSQNREFQIVIQDNSDVPFDMHSLCKEIIDDIRVVYKHVVRKISVSENCDLAIRSATGYYIIMIGDDDTVLTDQLIDLCRWMRNNGVDSISFNKGSFIWPDVRDQSSKGSYRCIEDIKLIEAQNLHTNLIRQITYRASGIIIPCVYHGLVRRDRLESIYELASTNFPGPSPDISNAIGLSQFCTNFVFCGLPYVISGHSKKSAAGMGHNRSHINELRNVPWLSKYDIDQWSDNLPFYWSAATITAESIIKSLERTGRSDLLEHFNISALYAHMIIYDRVYFKRIINSMLTLVFQNESKFSVYKLVVEFAKYLYGRVISKISIKKENIQSFEIDCINDCVDYISADFDERHMVLMNLEYGES